MRDQASAKKIAAALRAARRLDAVAGDSGGVLKDDDVWDLSMPADPIRPKPSSTLTNQQKLEPSNRCSGVSGLTGGFLSRYCLKGSRVYREAPHSRARTVSPSCSGPTVPSTQKLGPASAFLMPRLMR